MPQLHGGTDVTHEATGSLLGRFPGSAALTAHMSALFRNHAVFSCLGIPKFALSLEFTVPGQIRALSALTTHPSAASLVSKVTEVDAAI